MFCANSTVIFNRVTIEIQHVSIQSFSQLIRKLQQQQKKKKTDHSITPLRSLMLSENSLHSPIRVGYLVEKLFTDTKIKNTSWCKSTMFFASRLESKESCTYGQARNKAIL